MTIDGSPLARELEPLLESVLVDDHLHLPDMFLLTFRDIDRTVLAQAGIRIGSKVVISGSRRSASRRAKPLITGEVTAIEGGVRRPRRARHRARLRPVPSLPSGPSHRDLPRRHGLGHRAHGGHAGGCRDRHHRRVRAPRTSTSPRPTCRTGSSCRPARGRSATRSRSRTASSSSASRRPRAMLPAEGDFESQDPLQLVMGQELLEFRPRITASEQVNEVEVRAWDPSPEAGHGRHRSGGHHERPAEHRPGRASLGTFAAARLGLEPRPVADPVRGRDGGARRSQSGWARPSRRRTASSAARPTLRAGIAVQRVRGGRRLRGPIPRHDDAPRVRPRRLSHRVQRSAAARTARCWASWVPGRQGASQGSGAAAGG